MYDNRSMCREGESEIYISDLKRKWIIVEWKIIVFPSYVVLNITIQCWYLNVVLNMNLSTYCEGGTQAKVSENVILN